MKYLQKGGFKFYGISPPPGPNIEKFRLIFVKRGKKGVEIIIWSHFLLFVSQK